ncbi:MAG: alkaline phosphatase family protein [Ignavibacteria bacterium]|nr:alkaline phosphatase family protein [Ignavibacteria bacterium]
MHNLYKISLYLILFLSPLMAQMPDRYVILVIVDGARYSETLGDTSGRFTPNLKRLANEGVVIDSFFNNGWTVTSRGVPAIWSGSWSTPLDTFYNGFQTQYATVPTLWEYFRKAHQQDSTEAMYIMKYLSSPWLQSFRPDYGPAYWPWYILQGSNDVSVWQKAKNMLQTWRPRLSVIYFSDVDHYGHSGVWDDYTRAITIADSLINQLWEFVKSDPVLKDKTTILVTNDHGRHTDGVSTVFVGHGDGCAGCRRIMLFGIGANVKRGIHTITKRYIPDIVPTIGSILNFPTPVVSGVSMSEILDIQTDVLDETIPGTFALDQNFPNPFNPGTNIKFSLPSETNVKLEIYNAIGEKVVDLIDADMAAGRHQIYFDASGLPSGIYLYRLLTGNRVESRKMILLK